MIEWRPILRFIAKVLFSIGLSYAYYLIAEKILPGRGMIGFVIAVGFWGRLFSREIIEFVLLFKYWGERDAVFHWHGKYYVFDGRQIRFFLIDDAIWIALKDVRKVLQPKVASWEIEALGREVKKLEGSRVVGISETGLMKLLDARTEDRRATYPMIRLKRWLLHSAFPNVRRMPRSAINHPYSGQ